MKKLFKYSVILTVILAVGQVSADFSKAGRTSLQFLKIGIGARSVAMSEACIADVTGANAIFWNPAGLSLAEGGEAAFNYAKWIGDLNVLAAALSYNFKNLGSFGISFIGLDYGDLQEALVTSPTGNLDTRTGLLFSGSDMAVGLTYARKFTDKLSIGVTVKYLREDLFNYSTSIWGFDVGSYYNTGWKGIRIAMTAQNFAQQARFLENREEYEQTYELPLVFRIGWSIDLLGGEDLFLGGNPESHQLTFNMDAIHTNDYAERLHVGLEYWLFKKFALRTGYRFNYEEGKFSVGAGIDYPIGSMNIRIDYAYVDYDFLASTHRFTVILGL